MFTNEIMNADAFKAWRVRLELSQQEAAWLLDISVRLISYYENGGRNIDWRTHVACHSFEQWPTMRALIPSIIESRKTC
jgi:hypothetical protein